MKAIKGVFKKGVVELLEPASDLKENTEVVVYLEDELLKEKTVLKPQPVSSLTKLEGKFSLGGNAMEDAERYYE